MKRLSLALSLLVLFVVAAPAGAQKPEANKPKPAPAPVTSSELVATTPEMWFYQQYQQEYKDPQTMVRKAAEAKAAERQHRLASQQWYGMSNQRPRAFTDPFNGDYGPTWVSGNYYFPMQWVRSTPALVILPRESHVR